MSNRPTRRQVARSLRKLRDSRDSCIQSARFMRDMDAARFADAIAACVADARLRSRAIVVTARALAEG
jgi:hypothetical protein